MKTPEMKLIEIIFDPQNVETPNLARPGRLYVMPGDNVKFTTRNTAATIWIPNAEELFGVKAEYFLFDIERDGESEILTVREGLPKGREYPYAVYCREGSDFAEGNTAPRMIIEEEE